jgi:UDP-N-acetylglucosamine 2-epimerase (non-hydrolysing)
VTALRKIVSVVGTRPNFMKMAPIVRELARRGDSFEHVLIHTGQHYDRSMSDVFLEQLGVGEPAHMLGVGSGSHADQTGAIMARLHPLLEELAPDLVLVPGDVNSTLAAALAAAKLQLAIGHVEAGLRSFDRTMPEEVNRVVVDQIADLLFIHSPEALSHLRAEGRDERDVLAVGNTMIDTLVGLREGLEDEDAPRRLGLEPGGYIAVTLHRPALVDGPLLADAMRELDALAGDGFAVAFPAHPRTRQRLEREGIGVGRVKVLEPMPYLSFLSLVGGAAGVLTDSGGIQEETTYLGIPCFTLRDNTERPVTCTLGTNTLLGLDPDRIGEIPTLLAAVRGIARAIPPLWDGHAATRIADALERRTDYRGHFERGGYGEHQPAPVTELRAGIGGA